MTIHDIHFLRLYCAVMVATTINKIHTYVTRSIFILLLLFCF